MLKHETDVAIARRLVGDVLVVADDRARVGDFEPGDDAQQRRLAGAGRAEQREQLAVRHVEADAVERGEVAELLRNVVDGDAHDVTRWFLLRPDLMRAASARSTPTLATSVSNATQRQQRRHGERAGHVVFLKQFLDAQRHRVGLTGDVARDDVHGAELAHRARVAQDDAVDEAPLDVRHRDLPEHLPAVGAEADRGEFLFDADRLHHRNQLARDERERDERRRQDQPGRREDDLQARVFAATSRSSCCRSERDHEHQRTAHHVAEPGVVPPAAALHRIDRSQHEVQQHDRRPRASSDIRYGITE